MTLSSRTVNETRAQFAYGNLKALPSDPIGPAVSIAGVASFGTLSGSPQGRLNKMYQASQQSLASGRRACAAGRRRFHLQRRHHHFSAIGSRGIHVFVSRELSVGNIQPVGLYPDLRRYGRVSRPIANVGMYVQDEWKVNSVLTVNAGVRYDLQFLETIDDDADNVSPRLGFAWTPTESRRTVVRGSAGLFFDRVPLRALANALLSAGNTTDLSQLQADQCQPVADPGWSARVSERAVRRRAVGDARESDDDGSKSRECVLASGKRGSRAAD